MNHQHYYWYYKSVAPLSPTYIHTQTTIISRCTRLSTRCYFWLCPSL